MKKLPQVVYLQALPLRPPPNLAATLGQIEVGGTLISAIAKRSKFRSDSLSHLNGMMSR